MLPVNAMKPLGTTFVTINNIRESGLVQYNSFIDNNCKVYVKNLLSRYRKGIYDLPTLAIKLLDIPELDVADLIQKEIPRKDRLLEIERMKKKEKLPKDGICKLEELYLGRSVY